MSRLLINVYVRGLYRRFADEVFSPFAPAHDESDELTD
jgi:hypothetical protein